MNEMDNPCKHCDKANMHYVNDCEYGCDEPCQKAKDFYKEELGLKRDEDFFLIKDACLTELEPEEIDENGVGRVLTCIGFKPLPDELIQQISKKFQLYK